MSYPLIDRGTNTTTTEERQAMLDRAIAAQTEFWDALRDLESEWEIELGGTDDMEGWSLEDLDRMQAEQAEEDEE